jgi:hypothetical protein
VDRGNEGFASTLVLNIEYQDLLLPNEALPSSSIQLRTPNLRAGNTRDRKRVRPYALGSLIGRNDNFP